MPAVERVDAIVVGGGPAGLATAACLRARRCTAIVLDAGGRAGDGWRNRYDRLHLHTVKALSALPGLPFPADAPTYPSRLQVADYLDAYARHHRIDARWNTRVARIVRIADRGGEGEGGEGGEGGEVVERGGVADAGWRVVTEDGRRFDGRAVVVATGVNAVPRQPVLPGEASFAGRVVHGGDYRDPTPFAGCRTLVVGMGNTGAEIALDLAEHGVPVTVSIRSPVNIVRRDVLGRPTQRTSLLLARLPAWAGRPLAAWLRDLTVGDLRPYGLPRPATSPLADLTERGRTPVVDIGTVARIRDGTIAIRPAIATLTVTGARFVDGSELACDAIVLATGYRPDVARLFAPLAVPVDADGRPSEIIGQGELAGAYFVGFDVRQAGGLLRTIAQQAPRVAGAVAASTTAVAAGPG